jgi:hypothetical protein
MNDGFKRMQEEVVMAYFMKSLHLSGCGEENYIKRSELQCVQLYFRIQLQFLSC